MAGIHAQLYSDLEDLADGFAKNQHKQLVPCQTMQWLAGCKGTTVKT